MQTNRRLVRIDWLDALSLGQKGWKQITEVEALVPCKVVTVGWVVKETKTSIAVVNSITDDGACDGDICIPLKWVTRIQELKSKDE